ncbi:molybdopterin-binding domain-containing protein [Elioraea thermophila]|uniref:hypothetical protein n=1 Tax=Elioraea thermophila TaxID=2185104 RepID=UPI000DF466B4|nr:hypothetical protein [Elioraea thermophila]
MDGSARLRTTLEDLRALIATARPLARIEHVALAEALGRVLAAPVVARAPVPARPLARRAGFAVASAETLGAGPYAPLPLSRAVPVRAGAALPEGTDAVLAEEEAGSFGCAVQALAAVAPGENALAAGSELAAGETVLDAGARLTARALGAAAAAGLSEVAVRPRPRIAVSLDGPAGAMLRAAAGPALTNDTDGADVVIHPSDGLPRLACRPLEDASLARDGERWRLGLPQTAAAWLGWVALALPLLARLEGRSSPPPSPARLAGRVASAVGVADLVLVALDGALARPLASPDLPTWRAVAHAHGFVEIPPASEGIAEGGEVVVTPFA